MAIHQHLHLLLRPVANTVRSQFGGPHGSSSIAQRENLGLLGVLVGQSTVVFRLKDSYLSTPCQHPNTAGIDTGIPVFSALDASVNTVST